MIPAIELKAEGFEETDKQLKQFKADIKTKVRRAGLVEIAKPVKKTLKSYLQKHSQSGATEASIGHASVAKGDKAALGLDADSEAIIVGSTRKVLDSSGKKRWQQYKLNWLDKGTKPHIIKAKNGGYLKMGGRYVKSVFHPGVKAKGYLRRAYSAHSGGFGRDFERGAARALSRYGAKAT